MDRYSSQGYLNRCIALSEYLETDLAVISRTAYKAQNWLINPQMFLAIIDMQIEWKSQETYGFAE